MSIAAESSVAMQSVDSDDNDNNALLLRIEIIQRQRMGETS